MKNLASTAGWLLLAAVLAVPSFLFYNWWAKNKEKAVLERAQEMNSGAVFQSRTAPEARDRPESQSRTAPTPAAGVGGRPVSQPLTAPEETAGKGIGEKSEVRSQKSGFLTSDLRPLTSKLPTPLPLPVVDVSTRSALTSYFSPKSQRDPTTSPMEYQRIKYEEYQRAETERQQLAAERKHERETGIESKMRFQGVVGNAIIINGDMYNVGQKIFGAKILKVGTDYFIGEYKGKQFKKVLR